MKIFIISIVMWWGDPTMTPKNDAIEIGTMNGKPFYFTSQKDCFKHIDDKDIIELYTDMYGDIDE